MDFNQAQKEAILHKEGPVLVIAGAGTGKTRVITARIVDLIESKAATPGEILALTFTEKAASEMVERVDTQLPLGYEEIAIKTFHAFSDQILREAGLEIGLDPGYKLLTQVEQWFFLKENLFELDLDYYRPLGNPNYFLYDLLNHFGKLKDELITPEAYLEYCEKLEDEEKVKNVEIAKAYGQYQELLLKNNFLNFGDLTFYALKLLKERSSVLKEYQKRYKYILVDEFQDTNYAQFELITLLAGDQRNLFVVGDDDQSIYKWRGASLSNILQFEERFEGCKKIVLTENYRSTKDILDGAYALIQNNNPDRLEAKLGINKQLNCNTDFRQEIEVHSFKDFTDEAGYVAAEIEKLQKEEGADFNEFAILIRSNQMAGPFIDELKHRGIPYQVKNPKGLMSLDTVKDLIAVVRFLANPKDDISLLRILKMEVFDIPMAEILDTLNSRKNESLFSQMGQENLNLPGMEEGVDKVHNILSRLIEYSKKHNTGLVMNQFLQESDYLKNLVDNERFEELEQINHFAKEVANFEKSNENASVIDFVNYLDLLEEANASLASENIETSNAVQILTVHSSKGLEFDYVFIVNTVKHRFPMMKRRNTFEVPEELTKEIYPEGDFHVQEERRLFYVAMTRAKRQLYITYSEKYAGKKVWKVSPFVEEVKDLDSVKQHEADDGELAGLSRFKEKRDPIFELPKFNKKRLSHSQFETFKTCPLKYNYRYIMKVPVKPGHAANFGTSVHSTLNDFYLGAKRGEPVSLERLRELYAKNWIAHGYDSKEHEIARKEKGLKMLEAFYETNSQPWIMPAYLERPFYLKLGDFAVTGRIDRIDKLEDGTYEVIDYKTGKFKERENLKKNPQLSIYAMACRDVFKLPVSKLSLYYLEDNKKVSSTRNNDEIDALKENLGTLIAEMEKSDFKPTPGFLCQFCDYRLICPAV